MAGTRTGNCFLHLIKFIILGEAEVDGMLQLALQKENDVFGKEKDIFLPLWLAGKAV